MSHKLKGVWIIAVLPILTAVSAIVCALWRPARRLVWVVLAVAAINLMLTPLTSGELFYQRAEIPDYQQAVASGDFTAFNELLARHDPHLQFKMFAIAVGLLLSVALLAAVQFRSARGKTVPLAFSALSVGLILLVGAATFLQVHYLGTRLVPALGG